MRTIKPKRKALTSYKRDPNKAKKRVPQRQFDQPQAPTIHKEASRILAEIGKPEPSPFVPDPFQLEAVNKLRDGDVLVSAPTGSGKTWIAVKATQEYLAQGLGIWYATPLKALSNAKFEEFGQAIGPDNVGILTGDRKENAEAPVIVGTTEILRNQLYDAMDAGFDLDVDLVILDEAHYLGDTDRGVVWEEVLIYLPRRVRLLLLSATISNALELARWLKNIRNSPCSVVYSEMRPVPLHVLFRTPRGELTPFFRGKRLFPSVADCITRDKGRKKFRENVSPDFNSIIESLRQYDLLPAIFFLKSRSDCDRAIDSLWDSPLSEEEGGFAQAVQEQVELYPELKGRHHLVRLLECRAGAHHAGQLPAWRLLVERMMTLGHLEAIFSTSTVAAGVNFPARTVVLVQSDRFDGRSFVDMTATDLLQMAGRAGRRGMDKVGFVLIIPGRYMNVPLLKELFFSPPEPLQSKIAVNFSMVLNLLLSHDPDGVKKLLGLSFAAFHDNPRRKRDVQTRLLEDFQDHLNLLEELDYVDSQGRPTYDGRWAAQLRLDHPLLIAELIRAGELRDLDSRELAAVIAPFVVDKDREILVSREIWERTRKLWKRFRKMIQKLKPLVQFMIARGFSVPSIMFWPAASMFLWAEEVDWDELTNHIRADEGDLSMLILRTADHLRQLTSLEAVEPQLAANARTATSLLVRPPLV